MHRVPDILGGTPTSPGPFVHFSSSQKSDDSLTRMCRRFKSFAGFKSFKSFAVPIRSKKQWLEGTQVRRFVLRVKKIVREVKRFVLRVKKIVRQQISVASPFISMDCR